MDSLLVRSCNHFFRTVVQSVAPLEGLLTPVLKVALDHHIRTLAKDVKSPLLPVLHLLYRAVCQIQSQLRARRHNIRAHFGLKKLKLLTLFVQSDSVETFLQN